MFYDFLEIHSVVSMGLLLLSMVLIPSVTKDVPDFTLGQKAIVFAILITPIANIIFTWYAAKIMLGFGNKGVG